MINDTKPYRKVWKGMIYRCNNPKNHNYRNYGARGITVCDSWLNFKNFYNDMGKKPSSMHSLDRINNDLGYSKENCRWATKKEQERNTRRTVFVEFLGQVKPMAEWVEMCGFKKHTIRDRLRMGWSIPKAILTPYSPKEVKNG